MFFAIITFHSGSVSLAVSFYLLVILNLKSFYVHTIVKDMIIRATTFYKHQFCFQQNAIFQIPVTKL